MSAAVLYIITASKLTDQRTLSTTSPCYALAALILLAKEGFDIRNVMDQHGRSISVGDVRQASNAEEAVDSKPTTGW